MKIVKDGRWSIFIDIEGFSNFDENRQYSSFDFLLCSIYKIATMAFPNEPERLFVHHIGGDALLIVSSHPESDLSRAISIATTIHRSLILNGITCKTGISVGDFADISGCWINFNELASKNQPRNELFGASIPEPIDHSKVMIGESFMFLRPVLGTSFISAYHAQSKGPSGPNLIVPNYLSHKIPKDYSTYQVDEEFTLINWSILITDNIDLISKNINDTKLVDCKLIQKKLTEYLLANQKGPSEKWLANAKILENEEI